MRWLAGLAEAVVLAAAVGACSSSTSSISVSPKAVASPMAGTETLIGTMTGAAAARWLNSYGSAPPSFASLVFTGPVDTTLTGPVTVGSGNATPATHTFATPAGNLTILTAASMLPDKTFCDLLSGNVSAKGTSVTFKASGPLTLKQ
jgi:hypothetical protein